MSARIPRKNRNLGQLPKLAALAAGIFLSLPQAWAVGFGPLRVQSSLGQPFLAEIDVNGVAPEDAQNLKAKLSSPDAYKQAGISYTGLTSSIRLALVPRANGKYVIRASSTEPARDPFVDLMVDLSWASGKATRAYTALLDPADTKKPNAEFNPGPIIAPEAAPSSPVAAPSAATPTPVYTAPTYLPAVKAPRSKPIAPPKTKVAVKAPNKTVDRYTVKQGDTLSHVAEVYTAGDSVSLDQMLLAMYRANPNAFIGGNINRLKSGTVLNVPDSSKALAVSKKEAHRQVIAQTQGFTGYRSRLAAQASKAAPSSSDEGRQSTGQVRAKVVDSSAATTGAKDQLKLSKPEVNKAGSANASRVEEQKIANDRQLKESQAQATQLAKNNAELQRLRELKSAALGAAAGAAVGAATSTAASTAVASAPQISTAGTKSIVPAVASTASVAVAAASLPVASTAVVTASAASAPVAVAASKPIVKPVVVVTPPPAEDNFFADLLSNPMTQLGGGALAALGGVWYILSSRRKKKEQEHGFEHSLLSQDSTVIRTGNAANSLMEQTGGVSVDTDQQHSVFNTNFDNGGGSHSMDANEVDPIAEADVYIAYDRDTQAEEILREALLAKPDRQALRLKLLEIYTHRGDTHAFESMAKEIHDMTKGEGDDWSKAMAMGRKLDANNRLYHGSEGVLAPLPPIAGDTLPMSFNNSSSAPEAEKHDNLAPLDFTLSEQAAGLVAPTETPVPAAAPAHEEHSSGAVNLNDLADDLEKHTETHAFHASAPMSYDLSNISLNLNDAAAEHEATLHTGNSLPPATQETFRDSQLGGLKLQEPTRPRTVMGQSASKDMKTKFDLALAYVDIGDKDGARELFKEVVEHGDEALRSQAKEQLIKLS